MHMTPSEKSEHLARFADGAGFVAALDQSGGSTPSALRHYGIPDSAYDDEAQMFALVQKMRERIITSPAFTGDKVLAAILFVRTLDSQIEGRHAATFLWETRRIVTFLKVDQGLEPERDGVQLMKPIPGLDALLERAVARGAIGTKMRSVIARSSASGVAAIVAQQFELAEQIAGHGLLPIVEPEISIDSPNEAAAEDLLLAELRRTLDALPSNRDVVLKLTLPTRPGLYATLAEHPRVVRILALSGGYSRDEACRRLTVNPGTIASFSRALLEDLRADMSEAAFDAALAGAVDQIYRASVEKAGS
jgi:fructose-bisphosphate aldolase, class I